MPVSVPGTAGKVDFRLIAAILLLAVAIFFTPRVIEGLSARRALRTELAEISHVRYGLLNANVWVAKLVPILDAEIDALDLRKSDQASLRPTVENALNRLLDAVKEKMSAPAPPAQTAGAGGLGGLGALSPQGNPLIVNMIVSALRPHVPEYADTVLAELARPENKAALEVIRSVLAEGAGKTFGNVNMRYYDYILKEHGCTDGQSCHAEIESRIEAADRTIAQDYLTVLAAAALGFLLLMIGRPLLGRFAVIVLLLFCIVLLANGVLTPMLEVEAKISSLSMTLLGAPITFSDQLLYFQSKSVLEVFHTLVTMGQPEMWVVGVLVLTFSVVFPFIKICALTFCLFKPELLRRNRVLKFFALESSKWSMADVMAVAIFMSFVAFNGLIGNSMNGLREMGAQLTIPTNSSKILPGYYLFIGFCLASLFLSKKLEHGIRRAQGGE